VRFRPGITSGSVLVSGSGDCGQLGLGLKHSDLSEPAHLSLLDRKNIVKITCGGMHSIALDCDGGLWTWGCNDDYTLGRVDKKDEGVPRRVTAMTEPVIEISAGACHSAVLTKGGDVYTWGTYKDSNGHIGFKIGDDDELVFKQQLPALMEEMAGKDVCQLASGSDFTLALTKDGAYAAMCVYARYSLAASACACCSPVRCALRMGRRRERQHRSSHP
jgi:regulator of chromosome condensation